MVATSAKKKFSGKLRSDHITETPMAPKPNPTELPQYLDEARSALVQGARLRCSRCRGFGHVAEDCTAEDIAPVNERCYKCGEAGHMARQCSKKGSLNAYAPGRAEMREFKRKMKEKVPEERHGARRENRGPQAGKVSAEELDRDIERYQRDHERPY